MSTLKSSLSRRQKKRREIRRALEMINAALKVKRPVKACHHSVSVGFPNVKDKGVK